MTDDERASFVSKAAEELLNRRSEPSSEMERRLGFGAAFAGGLSLCK